jgi:hypothetical protein
MKNKNSVAKVPVFSANSRLIFTVSGLLKKCPTGQ